MRLIDADDLLTAFPYDDEPTITKSCIRMTIKHMPTIEAVSVVRCKDCKWHEDNFCANFNVLGFEGDDFCSMGERRKDEDY